MIEQLVRQGYEQVAINDYHALINNFRNQLNRFNESKLEDQPLTDTEFSRFLTQIDGKSIFETKKNYLTNKFSSLTTERKFI
ncbi:hypothetical protein NDK43_25815 [Neobacillus pocheonensis]|uniref:Uncharacterized protein n=1 Tax=Neobacillus pocheonensis TaxID=363869 RepID=A0ABT0WFQ8_9BACI|nr:hypothetical protein [Neobacillus pocheonensis]